jgi:hypothetical protein
VCLTADDNLLSVSRFNDKGYGSVFCDGYCLFPNSLAFHCLNRNCSKDKVPYLRELLSQPWFASYDMQRCDNSDEPVVLQ